MITITITIPKVGNVGIHTTARNVPITTVRAELLRGPEAFRQEIGDLDTCPVHLAGSPPPPVDERVRGLVDKSQAVVDCWGVGRLNILAMTDFVLELRAALAAYRHDPGAPHRTGPVDESAQGPVDFYEREFYPLSNFSSFTLEWYGQHFDTSEAAYHWMKFPPEGSPTPEMYAQRQRLLWKIMEAQSAHEAFKLAERNKPFRRPDWDNVKVDVMRGIIRAKADQHEYVKRKLMETGDRPLVEGSWRDDFWGIGPNGDGRNMLGKLWMELRDAYRQGEE